MFKGIMIIFLSFLSFFFLYMGNMQYIRSMYVAELLNNCNTSSVAVVMPHLYFKIDANLADGKVALGIFKQAPHE